MSDQEIETYEDIRNKRKELMGKKFPRYFTLDVRSERHFFKFKLKASHIFGKDNFKKTWYYEDISGKNVQKLFYNASQGQLLDPVDDGDIKPQVLFGVTDDVPQESVDKFITEMKKLVFKTPVVELFDKSHQP